MFNLSTHFSFARLELPSLFLKVINLPFALIKEETFVLAMITSMISLCLPRLHFLLIVCRHAGKGIDINETFDRLEIKLNTLQFSRESERLTSSDTQFSPQQNTSKKSPELK